MILNSSELRLMMVKWIDISFYGNEQIPEDKLQETLVSSMITTGFGKIINDNLIVCGESIEKDADIKTMQYRSVSIIPIQNVREVILLRHGKSIKFTTETKIGDLK